MRPELQILCCSHSPPSGKGVYFRSESLRWYKITFPKAFLAPERDMICILLWYLAVKPAPRNEFVLLITNCSGERHEGWGGRDFCASAETMHRAAPLFNHHYQSRQAGSKRRLFRAQGTETDSVCGSHFTLWPVLRWRWLFSDSQPVRILCACKILLLVCYTNTPCSRCLWETGVINSEMITDIYILHERTASYLHFSESHEQN